MGRAGSRPRYRGADGDVPWADAGCGASRRPGCRSCCPIACGRRARLCAGLAEVWKDPRSSPDSVVTTALSVLQDTTSAELRLQAVRLIMRALGDYHCHDPSVEIYTASSLQSSLAGRESMI